MWRKWRNRARELSIQREEENLNAEINLEGENLAMDSGEKYWGWKSAKETLEGQKQTKRKGERMQVRDYAEHGFSRQGKGWEEGCYRLRRREKVERRADQQCESGPILYRAIPPVRGWSHPIRAVWGIMQLRERDQPRLLSRRGKKAK